MSLCHLNTQRISIQLISNATNTGMYKTSRRSLIVILILLFAIMISILLVFDRLWAVQNGIDGETCANKNTNSSIAELWCEKVLIPDCVDRTIKCSSPPIIDDGGETKLSWYKPPDTKLDGMPSLNNENGTRIDYQCTSRRYFFDYAYDTDVSFYYTQNIDSINVTCTKDG